MTIPFISDETIEYLLESQDNAVYKYRDGIVRGTLGHGDCNSLICTGKDIEAFIDSQTDFVDGDAIREYIDRNNCD